MSEPAPKRIDPIGVFDSGVGGLSVLRAIRQELPAEKIIYLGDQVHVPYGPRRLEEVRRFSEQITRFLIEQGAKLIVVACNAASAAALQSLRESFPQMAFVGMEPAVKPAAERTRSGVVGVLATPATFQGALYASVIERFANGVRVLQATCPGLVEQIENGRIEARETRLILENALIPMLQQKIDTIVLGCTHYPFVIPVIQSIVGPQVKVIDPAPAVARQVRRLLAAHDNLACEDPRQAAHNAAIQLYTTGEIEKLQPLLPRLLGESLSVQQALWLENGQLGKLRRDPPGEGPGPRG
jgi:glutamate racemase